MAILKMSSKLPIFLFAFANDAEGSLRLGEEQNACWNELAPLDQNGIIDCQQMGFATLEQIYREFNRYTDRVYLFHYGGHSNSELIQLHGISGSAKNLGAKIGQQKNLKLVFLNGCKNHGQVEALFAQGVPAVIATTTDIEDRRAIELAQQFYQALAGGSSIREAFESARTFLLDKHPELESTIRNIGFQAGGNRKDGWALYAQDDSVLDWRIDLTKPSDAPIAGKNIVSSSTITAGGNVSIGDQIQHVTESKTSRNIRLFLLVFVPLLAITTAVLYYRYQQMQKPLLLTVMLDNRTPNPELDKGFGGQMMLSYGAKADTQSIVNETTFKGIPANYRKETVRLKFAAKGFQTVDTIFTLNKESLTLPIRRDRTYARLAGQVTDEAGNPVADAKVSTQNITGETDDQGQFSLDIPFEKQRKQQRLTVSKAGFNPWDRTEPVFPNEIIRIQLEQNNIQ